MVTELRLAGAGTIDQANVVLRKFLPWFNGRFAVAAEQTDTAYRLVPTELSLTETICIRDTRKVARDNTVKYHWRVMQLLPEEERPSYAGLRVDVHERPDGELMIRYQGKAVDFLEYMPWSRNTMRPRRSSTGASPPRMPGRNSNDYIPLFPA